MVIQLYITIREVSDYIQ